MPQFKSWQSYRSFARSVHRQLRYIRTPEGEEFLKTVLATIGSRKVTLKKGSVFWRAQLGHDWREEKQDGDAFEVPCAHPPARMRPLRDRAWDGRTNPRGIPCLYLSTKKATAVHEVRPWIGSYVSVAQFSLVRDVTIVVCAGQRREWFLYFEEPTPEKTEEAVWSDIDSAFAEPMTPSDALADYAPTQIIAELFKSKGFDGVGYRSNFADGINVALFDIDAAQIVNCQLHLIDSLEIKFSEQDNMYFVQKAKGNKVTRKKPKRNRRIGRTAIG